VTENLTKDICLKKRNSVKKIAEGVMEKVVEEAENLRYQVTILR
jgi:hypothetical protein